MQYNILYMEHKIQNYRNINDIMFRQLLVLSEKHFMSLHARFPPSTPPQKQTILVSSSQFPRILCSCWTKKTNLALTKCAPTSYIFTYNPYKWGV